MQGNGSGKGLESFPYEICFIGGGNMALAIASSIINQGLSPTKIFASAPSNRNAENWHKLGTSFSNNNSDAYKDQAIVFLSMKPQYLKEAVISLPRKYPRCIVSMLVGVEISSLRKILEKAVTVPVKILRIMPNTPIKVGRGSSAICAEDRDKATLESLEIVKKLLEAGGSCEVVSESLLNVTSAVIGSGPAFMYVIMEALSDGAVLKGLPREKAIKFAAEAMRGASEMVLQTGKHPALLKDEVCSPFGSTIAGIHALEKAGVRSSMMDAIESSFQRALDISAAINELTG